MDEKIREAMTEVLKKHNSGFYANQWAKDIVAEVEAKLSPQYPPKGAICEVWNDNWELSRAVKVYIEDGLFADRVDAPKYRGVRVKHDHYRRIVTAEDVVQWMHHEGVVLARCEEIQRLIDNAERG